MGQEIVINTIFQVKRGESNVWATLNPILQSGEPGYEIDTGVFKIGNGIDKWSELPVISTGEVKFDPFKGININDILLSVDQDTDKIDINMTIQDSNKTEAQVIVSADNTIVYDLGDVVRLSSDDLIIYGGNASDMID